MNPEALLFPSTLGELMERLKSWRARLLNELEDRVRGGDAALRLVPCLAPHRPGGF